ncbi:MAG: MFS transporter, partial [Chloroflexi bacterium]|nr:MFS transporter [Chloroflexota bacterium]
MDRSLWAVLAGTFTLRFSTGLTGAMLTFYLARLGDHHGILDQALGLGPGEEVSEIAFAIIAASFYLSELVLSPVFGVLSDRLGHWRVMQFGPFFGVVAVVVTWATTNLPLIVGTRLLEGSATAASIPSILGFIAVATAMDEGLRGRAVARFEAATLAGLLAGFA